MRCVSGELHRHTMNVKQMDRRLIMVEGWTAGHGGRLGMDSWFCQTAGQLLFVGENAGHVVMVSRRQVRSRDSCRRAELVT